MLQSSIEEVSLNIDKQTLVVGDSSSAVAEMTSSIASVANSIVKADENVKRMKDTADTGKTSIMSTLGAMNQIKEASVKVLETADADLPS